MILLFIHYMVLTSKMLTAINITVLGERETNTDSRPLPVEDRIL